MSSSNSARAWAPQLDLTASGTARFDPARVQEAIDRGYEAGLAAGRIAALEAARAQTDAEIAKVRDRADAVMWAVSQTADRLAEHEASITEAFAHKSIVAATELAEAIVRRELADETRRAAAACERTLAALDRGSEASVRLHPDDIALLAGFDLPPNVRLEADETLTPGDAIAHAADRTVDARIATAIERAKAAFGAEL